MILKMKNLNNLSYYILFLFLLICVLSCNQDNTNKSDTEKRKDYLRYHISTFSSNIEGEES